MPRGNFDVKFNGAARWTDDPWEKAGKLTWSQEVLANRARETGDYLASVALVEVGVAWGWGAEDWELAKAVVAEGLFLKDKKEQGRSGRMLLPWVRSSVLKDQERVGKFLRNQSSERREEVRRLRGEGADGRIKGIEGVAHLLTSAYAREVEDAIGGRVDGEKWSGYGKKVLAAAEKKKK